RHIPVIVVTGAAFRQNEALIRSFEAGAVDFIHKPLNEIELFGRLRVALSLYRERKLRQSSLRRIIDNEARFCAILNHAPVGIAHVDGSGRFLLVNDSLCALVGYDHAALLDLTLQDLCPEAELRGSIEALLAEAQDSGGCTREMQLKTRGGERVWINLSASPLLQHGHPDGSLILTLENITERRATADQMQRMVYYDPLTQLPNRLLFNRELERALTLARQGHHQVAVLFLDLDNFKNINDSLGHVIGDRLLQSVAKRVVGCIRSSDVFARFGGDEFTLLLPHIHDVEDACRVAQKILDQLERPIQVDEHDFYAGTSIGISFYPQDGEDVATLVKNADTAMYRAKELGRRNYQLFNPSMDTHVQQRLDLEQDLRRSLEQGDFRLYYQPQVRLSDMRIVGIEALLRWRHPRRGLLCPKGFLPLAEESGLIIALGDWVLRESCRQARQWLDAGYGELVVYVNLSRRQFQQPNLLGKIRDILDEFGLPPNRLGIEITESVNSLDTAAVITNLRGFRELGIRTAIDDFGVGFSSLNNLKHFPLHSLKIDKSFIQDALHDRDDLAIIQTVIALGRSFGLEVIAEGVETRQILELVRAYGCDIAQGYYFSQPLPAEELDALLRIGHCPVMDG
ncbi:MAG TPA: EAL domain-containing protein, partial [Candidatus Competibacteraceae bacterium]|nr:EAL domain-containing protein [Candidatus Competibacteraceae bacterium]